MMQRIIIIILHNPLIIIDRSNILTSFQNTAHFGWFVFQCCELTRGRGVSTHKGPHSIRRIMRLIIYSYLLLNAAQYYCISQAKRQRNREYNICAYRKNNLLVWVEIMKWTTAQTYYLVF